MAKTKKPGKAFSVTARDLRDFAATFYGGDRHGYEPKSSDRTIFTTGEYLKDYSGGAQIFMHRLDPIARNINGRVVVVHPDTGDILPEITADDYVTVSQSHYDKIWKPKVIAAKKCKAYEELFKDAQISATTEKYLRHFAPLDQANFKKLHEEPYPEFFRMDVYASLARVFAMYKEDEEVIKKSGGIAGSVIQRDLDAEKEQIDNTIKHFRQLYTSITTPMAERLELRFLDDIFIEKLEATIDDLQAKLDDLNYFEREVDARLIAPTLLAVRLITNILNFDVYTQFRRLPQDTEKAIDRDVEALKKGGQAIHSRYNYISAVAAQSNDMSFAKRQGYTYELEATPIGLPTKNGKSSELRDIIRSWCECVAGEKTHNIIEARIKTLVARRFGTPP